MKNITIGLFGFGCVGQGLYETINSSNNFNGEIKKICIKHPEKHRKLPAHLFTTNASEILQDEDIDIIVELIDDAKAAKEIVFSALQNGKSVVTANKKMIAENLQELVALQEETGKAVLYEGAVCGSIPVIRTLEEYFGHEPLNEIKGIFNGSTNYILTQLFEKQLDYDQALADAQQLGFAEADPSLDVKGYDAKYKLSILLTHAFGLFVKPEHIFNQGIDAISNGDLDFARQNDLEIKLMASAYRFKDKVFGFVLPQFIKKDHSLINVKNEFNAVSLIGEFCDEQRFIGKGAGSLPTGAAVLSDVSALSYDYRYEYKKQDRKSQISFSNDALLEVYVSFDQPHRIELDAFDNISERYFSFDQSYVIGEISLKALIKKDWINKGGINLVLTSKSPRICLGKLSIEGLKSELEELQKGKELLSRIAI
jgi:homoserine dehydrogenase